MSTSSDNVSCPISGPGSRKEKKKQAKEERDRLKQVEKKKRRLEKALATATAIRIELEKKKQRRKEEEQRLDEEGAALAEAVALQVLVEEEVNSFEDNMCENAASKLSTVPPLRKAFIKNATTSDAQPTSVTSNELIAEAVSMNSISVSKDKREEVKRKLVITDWELFSNPRDNLTYSSERAKAAELAAGMAAAQAVAALKIAEEARAEAEAAKKAAEAAICQVMDRKYFTLSEADQQATLYPLNIEMERDELKARLEETERRLKEKTKQVFHLEQSLEDMTQYLLCLKSKLPLPNNLSDKETEVSERSSTNLTESSQGITNY
ncbi:hypothetical protein GOP47_0022064 [Adiantum capillus-veneris]|uniref:Uncharacterized protein n=1 Tax=Adiantum capillus-veneris TaxID=13818 RepID=A0A9D4Z7H7_ADICA|nr:hypothetical protein GOP47_0022064 [Adiantum capillus-veneris]